MLRLKVHNIRSSNKFGPQTIRRIIVKILTTFQLTALNKKHDVDVVFLFQKDSMSTILLLMTTTEICHKSLLGPLSTSKNYCVK